MFVCAETNFGAIFYKSLILCSTDQLTEEVIRNCDMTFFSRKIDIHKKCLFYVLRNTYSFGVICLLPHEVVVYNIKLWANT